MKTNRLTKDKYSEQDTILWWNAARTHFAKKEYTKAIEVLNILLEIDPEDINALLNKGAALYFLKRYEEALQCFEIILINQPSNANALKNKAGVLYNLGRYDEANAIYDLLLKKNKNDISILKNKALTLIKLKRKEEAIAVYKVILRIDPQNKPIAFKLAELFHEEKLFHEELSVYNLLLVNEPDDTDLLNKKGVALLTLGRYDEAIDIFNEVLSIESDNAEALSNKNAALSRWNTKREEEELQTAQEYKLTRTEDLVNEGNDLLERKQYTEALAYFEKVLESNPDNNDALLGKAIILAVSDNHVDALRYFDTILQSDPSNVKALINKGELLSRLNQYARALVCFENVLDIEPGNFRAICNKEDTLSSLQKLYSSADVQPINNRKNAQAQTNKLKTNETEKNESEFKSDNELNIDEESNNDNEKSNTEFESLLSGGYSLLKANKLNDALQTFTQAARINSRDTRVLSFLGTTYYLLNKFDKAIICYDKVLESKPYNVNILSYKGNALVNLKKYDDAITYYDRALSVDPENVDVLSNKAIALTHMEDYSKAIECYNQVLQKDKNNTEALYQLGMIYKDSDDYAEAINCFDRLLTIDPNYNDAYQQKEEIELFIEQIIEDASLPDHHERLQRVADANLGRTEVSDVVMPNKLMRPNEIKSMPKTKIVKDPSATQRIITKPVQVERKVVIEKVEEEPIESITREVFEDEPIDALIAPKVERKIRTDERNKHKTAEPAYKTINRDTEPFPRVEEKQAEPYTLGIKEEKRNTEKQRIQSYANKARIAIQNESWKEAIESLNQLLKFYPSNIELLNLKGNALAELSKYEQAIECFDTILYIDKDNIDALNSKGVALANLDEYNEAIECYNEVLAIDRDDVDALNNKGNALYELSRHNESIEHFDRVLALDKHNTQVLYNKAMVCFECKQITESARCFAQLGYTSLDLLSLFSSYPDEEERVSALIQAIIELNEFDYFNQIVTKKSSLRSIYKEIYCKSLQIVKMLHVNNPLESRIAHYTSHHNASELFGLKNARLVSPFRLNSVASANDPKEGITLFDFLNSSFHDGNSQTDYQAFIGCFSFNTESLNQFRLYSKDQQTDSAGVNIVLNSQFFSNRIGLNGSLLSSETQFTGKNNNIATKESLFRCIYVDPQTQRIISLGHKEEYTIYRENENITDTQTNRYNTQITQLLVEIRMQIAELKEMLCREDLNRNIVSELLVVLRYLVKHVAFKAEQECRIINVEHLQSEKVKLAQECVFVEYLKMNSQNVDSVVCGPSTDQYKIFRDILLKKTGIRTQSCRHPFACDQK